MKGVNVKRVKDIIKAAIQEDISSGDVTSNMLIPPTTYGRAKVVFNEPAVVCGLSIIKVVYGHLDRNTAIKLLVKDGVRVRKDTTVAIISGPLRGILTGERTALNFLQRLSGIATLTREFIDAVKGYKVEILDTRKTTPGLRELERYAVRCGGGVNHRMGLYDAILIKDNHIKNYKSHLIDLEEKVSKIRNKKRKIFIEIEAKSVYEAVHFSNLPVNVIMLDNMPLPDMERAIDIIRKDKGKDISIEASGGVSLKNVRAIAETGVDRISVGAITHSAKAVDISLEVTDIYPRI